jgi:hypothetical protein
VELRAEEAEGGGSPRFTVWDDRGQVGTVAVASGTVPHQIAVRTRPLTERAEARALVGALAELARPLTGAPVFVEVWDDLVRFEARRAGWTGSLRAVLQPGLPPDQAPSDDIIVSEIGALLPSVAVSHGFRLNRRIQTLNVTNENGRRLLRLRLADREDLMPELVAAAIDTTLAIKRRFGRAAAGVLALSFDHGGPRFTSGAIAGEAGTATGTIFLNPNLTFADEMVEQRRRAAAGATGIAAVISPPFTALDGVTAHELWHNLDAVIQAGSAYVEFNRELGEALGVATLEHALRGGERDAPPEWQAARRQLAREVSIYATTQPREATAEMFKVWWCSVGEPTPVVARFGELVDRFYPRPDPSRA